MNFFSRLSSLLSFGRKLGKFFLVGGILDLLTGTVDVLMIYFILKDPKWGFVNAFLIGTPMNLVLCTAVVWVNNVFTKSGHDITGLEELRSMAYTKYQHRQYFRRFVGWMLRQKLTIFLIGSWFYLDPDYVTLLLQDRKKGFWFNIQRITLPSVVLAMLVWTAIYCAAYQGYRVAMWLAF